MNNVQKILKEICDELNIKFKLVSQNWVIVMEKDNITKYVVGYKFPLNDQTSGKICDDKYAFYEIMSYFNIPVAEHFIIHKNYDKEKIINICNKYNNDVVIKANLGTCGNEVYHITDLKDIFIILDKLLISNTSVSLCPYYDIKTEYRTIILNGDSKLIYGKEKPVVTGDGKKTIYELLLEFNYNYFSKIKIDDKLKKILEKDHKYEYNWQFNLSKGAMPFLLDDKNKENMIKTMALNIANKVGVKFASIDIVELNDGSFLVLEANSGVMMSNFSTNLIDGKDIAKDIYKQVIMEMFK